MRELSQAHQSKTRAIRKTNRMKTCLVTVAIIIGSLVFFQSCKYDRELLLPVSNCSDTANISFTERIQPLLRASCFSCHGNGSNQGDVSLETYSEVKTLAVDGRLLGTISHSVGFAAMPAGAEKLDDCSIEAVRIWIAEGAREN
jgi:hypothetical protein